MSKGLKNILLLSSLPPILGITKDDGKHKPALLKFYDFSKGGTDIIDQRMGMYSVNTKSKRWMVSGFSYILDTIRVNSQTVFAMSKKNDPRKLESFTFAFELVRQLIIPHIITRKNSTVGLPIVIKQKMEFILGDEDIATSSIFPVPETSAGKRIRCNICLRNAYGKGYEEKRKQIPLVQKQCSKCEKFICKQHSVIVCTQCK